MIQSSEFYSIKHRSKAEIYSGLFASCKFVYIVDVFVCFVENCRHESLNNGGAIVVCGQDLGVTNKSGSNIATYGMACQLTSIRVFVCVCMHVCVFVCVKNA